MDRKEFLGALGLGTSALVASGCRSLPESQTALPEFGTVDSSTFWAAVRSQFPINDDRVYLNCGGLGPAPTPVLNAVQAKMMELQGISGTGYSIMDQARKVAGTYLGADSVEICFTRNATESNSIIAAGLKLESGDEVIFESHAHPGGSFP
jgi:selenocysteine lyase/cysteine desulfurase